MENCPIGAKEFTCSTRIRPAAPTSLSTRCRSRQPTMPLCSMKFSTRPTPEITTGSPSTSRPTPLTGKPSRIASNVPRRNNPARHGHSYPPASLTSSHSRHPHPNRLRNGAQFSEQLLIAIPIDVVNRISKRPASIQHLPLNIDPLIRQNVVNRPQDSRHIVVHMGQPVRAWRIVQMTLRQVHAQLRIPALKIIDNPRGNKLANILLRLSRPPADMRSQDHIRQPLQRA